MVDAVSGVEGDMSGNPSIFQSDPGLELVLAQFVLLDDNLTCTTFPIRVSAVARMPIETKIDAVTISWVIGKILGPLHAPAVRMLIGLNVVRDIGPHEDVLNPVIMAGEDSHHSNIDKCLHERCIGAIVLAIVTVVIAYIPLVPNFLLVKAWLSSTSTTAILLKGMCRMYWDVDKGQTGDGMADLLAELIVRLTEPCDNLWSQYIPS